MTANNFSKSLLQNPSTQNAINNCDEVEQQNHNAMLSKMCLESKSTSTQYEVVDNFVSSTDVDSDIEEIEYLFRQKPTAFCKWIIERAPPEILTHICELLQSGDIPQKKSSISTDIFQQWMASSLTQVCNIF